MMNPANRTNGCRPNLLEPQSGTPLQLVTAYFFPCFIVIGLIGNALTLITLNSAGGNKHSKKTSLFLSAKSATDFAVGAFALLMNLNAYGSIVDMDQYRRFYQQLFKPTYTILSWLVMSSTWYSVAVTFERMFAIGWPLRARHILTTRLILACIGAIPLISLLFTIYPLPYLTLVDYPDCDDPGRRVYLVTGPLSKDDLGLWYYGIISRYLLNLMAIVVPVLLLLSFNCVISVQLRQHAASMARFAQAGYNLKDANEQIRISVLVFVITAATAAFLLPSGAVVIYDTAFPGVKSRTYQVIVHTANMLVLCDKVLDFFLYCMVSSNFRSRLAESSTCSSSRGDNDGGGDCLRRVLMLGPSSRRSSAGTYKSQETLILSSDPKLSKDMTYNTANNYYYQGRPKTTSGDTVKSYPSCSRRSSRV